MKKLPAVVAKNGSAVAAKKKVESSDSSDSDTSSDEDDVSVAGYIVFQLVTREYF